MARHGPGFSREAMAEMRYADAFAREVLRIWGPAEFLFRQAALLKSLQISLIMRVAV